jgi:uncharacterized protein
MISETDKKVIVDLSKKYRAKRVLLFGSSLTNKAAQDIDLAVEGVADQDYFNFYGDLMFSLSKPVDLIDLSSTTKFTSIIKMEGLTIYG